MGNSKNDCQTSQQVPPNAHEEANSYEDEINLIDYFRVIWKCKYLILLGSVLPTLLVWLALFLSPTNYAITYVYDVREPIAAHRTIVSGDQYRDQGVVDIGSWNLDLGNYNLFLSRFYSVENQNQILAKLKASGFDAYAERIGNSTDRFKKFVKLETLPPFPNLSKVKVMDTDKWEGINKFKPLLLTLSVIGRPEKDIDKISSAIRDNLQNVVSARLVAEQLRVIAWGLRTQMANIEGKKFSLELTLKSNKKVLAKLRSIRTVTSNKTEASIILPVDIGDKSVYLPFEYQIAAAEAKVAQLEGAIQENEDKYKYHESLLVLNEILCDELMKGTSSGYTIQQFRLFLLKLAKEVDKEELKNYLSSYTKKIENRIAVSVPVAENPSIYTVSKATVKKSVVVFAVSLMISVFAALLFEGIQKSKV